MSHRYSRTEKEKWPLGSNKYVRRSPVRIPEGDNSALIEATRTSLIGRVNNPTVQRPRAIVEFMPQFWNMEGRVTGRVLGAESFQFRFQSEEDLLTILNKSPFHYKKWMLILQRWEPIVSPSFPSAITFWVKIHDIPPHHWSDQTIRTIGMELGHVSARDVEGARVRVDINGLRPLEVKMEIRLHKEGLTWVELEYEKLEKHCFNCFSLSHEKKDCPKMAAKDSNDSRAMGINQRKTLTRIDANKRKGDSRRSLQVTREHDKFKRTSSKRSSPSRDTSRHVSRTEDARRSYREDQARDFLPPRDQDHQRDSPPRRSFSRDHLRDSRMLPHSDSNRAVNAGIREGLGTHSREGDGRSLSRRSVHNRDELISHFSPPATQTPVRDQRSHVVPLPAQESGNVNSSSRERRPALERLGLQVASSSHQRPGNLSLDSGRMQDVEVRYLDEELQSKAGHGQSKSGTSRLPLQQSPSSQSISLRLGKQIASKKKQGKAKASASKAPASKAQNKRKVPRATTNPRGASSPLHGMNLRKQIANKVQVTAKKRLCVGQNNILPCNKDAAGPSSVLFPASADNLCEVPCKEVVDFRSPLNPLP